MKILVTGGAGYTASIASEQLCKQAMKSLSSTVFTKDIVRRCRAKLTLSKAILATARRSIVRLQTIGLMRFCTLPRLTCRRIHAEAV
jgi:hypothetical protein